MAIACPSKQHCTPLAASNALPVPFDLTFDCLDLGGSPLQLASNRKYTGQPQKADSVQATPHNMIHGTVANKESLKLDVLLSKKRRR